MTHDAGDQARSVEREIELPAPIDAVWKAISTAEELVRWFPLEARVTPGVGGSVWMRWDKGEFDSGRITIWEPGARLRTEDAGGTWTGIATDYYLRPNASGEGTILRVVSSGFGAGDSWDDAVGAFGRGWDFELRGLRHYLALHRAESRRPVWVRASYAKSHDSAWATVTRDWLGLATDRLRPGDRFATRTAAGNGLTGVVHLVQAPRQFVAALDQWNDAFFRIQLYGGSIALWLSAYGVPEAELVSVEREWQRSLDTALSAS